MQEVERGREGSSPQALKSLENSPLRNFYDKLRIDCLDASGVNRLRIESAYSGNNARENEGLARSRRVH